MRSFLTASVLIALIFSGCAKPPTQELDAAQAALDEAKNSEADIYAPKTYISASNSLQEARLKVEQQDYEGGKASAIQAKQFADRSRSEAEANKQTVRNDVQDQINRVSSGIADARLVIDSAPKGKGADEDLDQLRSGLGQAEASLSAARNNISGGKFKDAQTQSQSAESRMMQVTESVQTAIQKIEEWKKQNRPWFEL